MKSGFSYMEMKKIMNQEMAEVEVKNLPKAVPSLLDYDYNADVSDIGLSILRIRVYLNADGLSRSLIREFGNVGYELSCILKSDYTLRIEHIGEYYALFVRKER